MFLVLFIIFLILFLLDAPLWMLIITAVTLCITLGVSKATKDETK